MSDKVRPSATVVKTINTYVDNVLTDFDSAPTLVLDRNESASGVTVTVTNEATGQYKASWTNGAWTAGDRLRLKVSVGALNSVSQVGVIVWEGEIDELIDSRLAPTTAGRTIDIDANGYVERVVLCDTLTTNSDKTGYALSASGVTAVQSGLATAAAISALNDVSTADIDASLAAYDAPTKSEMDAAFTEIKGATWSSFTDTLEAIRDRGDSAWITATGFSTLDAAGIRTAVGLATANLDTQLGGVSKSDKLLKYIQLIARSDSAIATDNSTELGEINADGGSGAGDYSPPADSLEASQAEHDATQTAVSGIGGDATASNQTTIITHLTDIKGTGFAKDTHSLTDITEDVTGLNGAAMRGTDGANTTAPDNATIATISSNVSTLLTRIPSGIFTGMTSLAQWLGLIAAKHTGDSTARTELNATGAGSGTYNETTDSLEASQAEHDATQTAVAGVSGGSLTITPVVGVPYSRTDDTDITLYLGELRSNSVTIVDSDAVAVNLAGRTLQIVIEDIGSETDIQVIENANITVSGDSSNTIAFTNNAAVTASTGVRKWTLWDLTNDPTLKEVVVKGQIWVKDAAVED